VHHGSRRGQPATYRDIRCTNFLLLGRLELQETKEQTTGTLMHCIRETADIMLAKDGNDVALIAYVQYVHSS
jgi:hypothetical protein